MTKKLSDDIYVFLFYNKEDSEINFHIAQSLEDFEFYNNQYDIITWANITGKEMEIGEFVNLRTLSFLKDPKNKKDGTEK